MLDFRSDRRREKFRGHGDAIAGGEAVEVDRMLSLPLTGHLV